MTSIAMNTIRIISWSSVGLHQALSLRRLIGIAGSLIVFKCRQQKTISEMINRVSAIKLFVGSRLDRVSVINVMAGSIESPPIPIQSKDGLDASSGLYCGKRLIMIRPIIAGKAATMKVHLQLLIS